MIINPREIQKVVNNKRNYDISISYYYNANVTKLNIEYKGGMYVVTGNVEVGQYDNDCEIHMDIQGNVEHFECSCPFCGEDSACAHIGAMLHEVEELSPHTQIPYHSQKNKTNFWEEHLQEIEEQRKKEKERYSNNLIQYFKDHLLDDLIVSDTINNVEIHTFLTSNKGYLTLKFKLGLAHKYIIKNIHSFLHAISDEEYIEYGKRLAFVHKEECFDEYSLSVISLMRQLLPTNNPYEYYSSSKELIIKTETLDMFFDTYYALPKKYYDFTVEKIQYKPIIKLEEDEEYYKLTTHIDEEVAFGKKYIYEIENNKLYRWDTKHPQKTRILISKLINEGEVIVKKEKFNDFYTYILSDVIEDCELKTDCQFSILENKVEHEIQVYGDINDKEQIELFITYIYADNSKKSGFDEDNPAISLNAKKVEAFIARYAQINMETKKAYISTEDKNISSFISGLNSTVTKYAEVFISEAIKQLNGKSAITLHVGLTVKNDLLAVDINSPFIPKEELTEVLQAYKRKKKFYRLKGGELLFLESDTLAEATALLENNNIALKDIEDGQLELSLHRVFNMENMANQSENIEYHRDELFHDVVQSITNIEPKYQLNEYYDHLLREYQKQGYEWLETLKSYRFNGILADDMGLGKTLQVIALFDHNKQDNKVNLVVCPASLILNWEDEIHKFAPELKCISVYGSVDKRVACIKEYQNYDVLITSYDYIRRDIEEYQGLTFEYVVLDEAQYIKNPKTKNAQTVKRLESRHRLALTGTPIENSLAELWSIFDFLMPGYLYNYHHFQTHYEKAIVRDKDTEVQNQLRKLISPFILRRTKKEVLKELPEKIEKTMHYTFNEEESKLYFASLATINEELAEKVGTGQVDKIQVLAMLTRLRQICCEPRVLFEGINNVSSKMQGCLELIQNLHVNNRKVLLFSSFTSVLDLIERELVKEGISYYKITGKTSKDKRKKLVDTFQKDNTTVFLISLKAGGTGLNLTAADAVIHYDPWWNISAQNQATDRAHRIGQANTVEVYKLIMKDSIEEKIQELQEMKKSLSDSLVENQESSITTMSQEEILELFK